MPTIKDVARLAGVSHGTVSNVLKGSSSVSLENVRKVEKAIEELGYHPYASAISLRSESTRNIGIILPNITDSFYSQFYTTVCRILKAEDYSPVLYITDDIPHEELQALIAAESIKPAGLIIATCQPNRPDLFRAGAAARIPSVFIERDIDGLDCDFVGFRNDCTIRAAASGLLRKGYTRIGLIVGSGLFTSERLCTEGYLDAFKDAGLAPDDGWIRFTDGSSAGAFKATAQLYSMKEVPEAIFCSSTRILSGVLRALAYVMGGNRPLLYTLCEDAWGDSRFPEACRLPRPAEEMSRTAAKTLLTHIQRPAFHECRKTLLADTPAIVPAVRSLSTPSSGTPLITAALIEGEIADSLRSLLPDFKKATGIDAEIRSYPHEALYDKLRDESARSETDVFLVDVLWVQEMAKSGMLSDLTQQVRTSLSDALDILPMFYDSLASYNDRIYGVPHQYCCQLLFYRKDLFENYKYRQMFRDQYKSELKPPENWAEFNAVARFFTRAFNPESPVEYGTTLGGRFSSAAAVEYLLRFWSMGGRVFDPNGGVRLHSPEGIKALTNYLESYRYASPESPENWWYEQVHDFGAGRSAMMIMYASYATSLSDRNISRIVGKFDAAPVPGGCSVLGGWSMAINAKSRNREAALEFIKWSCGRDLAMPLMLLGSQTAGSRLYENDALCTAFPWLRTTLDCFPACRRRAIPENSGSLTIRDYEQIIARAVDDCILGKDVPDAALRKAAEHMTALMASV